MTNPGDTDIEGFVATGRTGRRNALPDILDDVVTKTSTSGLPADLDKLSFSNGMSTICAVCQSLIAVLEYY